jgi:hypothetical protein
VDSALEGRQEITGWQHRVEPEGWIDVPEDIQCCVALCPEIGIAVSTKILRDTNKVSTQKIGPPSLLATLYETIEMG